MSVCLLAKMLHILVLCPILLIGGVQTLTIDSQLGTSVEDCFERISIGEQLPNSAIYRNVTELTTRECEQICKQDKQCQVYDYGVGAKGNATCNLSTQSEKEVKEQSLLTRHPDYDVYVRRFHCEQSPPSPIQPLLDDPEVPGSNDRPQHRPVFRPDMDDRPLTGDYLVSSDINPYDVGSKPQSYRPDDIQQIPAYDAGPSYGDHKPQDIPYPIKPRPDPYRPNDSYRPGRPDPYIPERPNDPYRPERPSHHRPGSQDAYSSNRPQDPYRPQNDPYPQKPKPESNDVLQFEGYGKPPDHHRPEKPNYNYIIRPNRKPVAQDEYIKPIDQSNGQYGHPSGPIGPPYKPNRPENPTYSYNSQYASNYGQNTQNDNSVYVEIYDPPRPYVPIKDRPIQQNYHQGFLGYGTYSSQNSYNQASGYTGSITEIGYDHDRPIKPQRPYGQNYDSQVHFDGNKRPMNDLQPYQRPNDRYKPGNQNSYGSQNSYSNQHAFQTYGSSHSQSQSSYGYGESQPPYNQDASGYQKPQKPDKNKPYGDNGNYENHGSYFGNQNHNSNKGTGLYGAQSSQGYGSQGFENSQSYGQSTYGNSQGYGSSGNIGSHSSNQGSYGGNQASYGGNQASYGGNQASYGGNQASFGSNQASYGSNSGSGYGHRPIYDHEVQIPTYGSHKPEYDPKPGYGIQRPEYDSPKPGYGNERPDPGYGSPKPGYGSLKPDYDSQKPGYGNERPDPGYGSPKPGYVSLKPGYGSPKPGYGDERPDPGYSSTKPGGFGKPDGNLKPGYGNEKPDEMGYGSQNSDRPDVKPVYEYEMDKPINVPTYISRPGGEIVTSRPVVIGDYERPVYKDPGMSFAE